MDLKIEVTDENGDVLLNKSIYRDGSDSDAVKKIDFILDNGLEFQKNKDDALGIMQEKTRELQYYVNYCLKNNIPLGDQPYQDIKSIENMLLIFSVIFPNGDKPVESLISELENLNDDIINQRPQSK